jgi:outer membrane protein OmpU
MNKLKKLGLTALAGSLVATSAYAGSLDVTAGASIKYVTEDEDEVSGNPFSMGRTIGFSGGGDMDNGMSVNFHYTMADAAYSSAGLNVDMGDTGVFHFENGNAATGIMSMKDMIPIAGTEQSYDDMGSATDNGLVAMADEGTLGYKTTLGGYTASVNWNKGGDTSTGGEASGQDGSSHSVAVSGEIADGFTGGLAWGDVSGATKDTDETQMTTYVKYVAGAFTTAIQYTDIDKPSGTNDIDSLGYGITFAVNENLSIGASKLDVDFNDGTKTDEESTGFGASYTMGSMSLKGTTATQDAQGGAQGTDDKHTEIVLSFAF